MELAIAAVQQAFEVTFEPTVEDSSPLPVAMSVYDTTGGTPVLVQGPTAMVFLTGSNTYVGFFTPTLNHSYLILKAVYTDGTYAHLDTDYAQGSETIFAIPENGSNTNLPSINSLIGIVNVDQPSSSFNFPVFTCFLGDVLPLPLKAMYDKTFNPLDLTNCTEIVVSITNADGSILQLKKSLSQVTITSPPVLGQFVANFTSVQSALFMVGELQNIDVTFTISSLGTPITIRYFSCFSVFQVP